MARWYSDAYYHITSLARNHKNATGNTLLVINRLNNRVFRLPGKHPREIFYKYPACSTGIRSRAWRHTTPRSQIRDDSPEKVSIFTYRYQHPHGTFQLRFMK